MPTLLCVDDSKTALYARKLVLEKAGYYVVTATDVRAAMQVFTSLEVDVVLTDYFLQDTTCSQLISEMKRLRPHIPVVILSGAVEVLEDITQADLFISKVEAPPVMLQKLSELLR